MLNTMNIIDIAPSQNRINSIDMCVKITGSIPEYFDQLSKLTKKIVINKTEFM